MRSREMRSREMRSREMRDEREREREREREMRSREMRSRGTGLSVFILHNEEIADSLVLVFIVHSCWTAKD